jgi:thymidylate synthase ThyX
MGNKISARIIADSINQWRHRIITYVLVYPRYIHSEFMTHRMFSRNAASSRAVPFKRMLKLIQEDPFIPVAFQKDHSGMQGTEYITDQQTIDYVTKQWLFSRDCAIDAAQRISSNEVTKQVVNRLLEPFMWYTCIVTATEYDNFFDLRCPEYHIDQVPLIKENDEVAGYSIIKGRSRKELTEGLLEIDNPVYKELQDKLRNMTDLDLLKLNRSSAEIHISLLAEAMWDARNESTPKELQPGEWHVPFGDNIQASRILETFGSQTDIGPAMIKIATARCARVSYLNFEGKDDYEDDLRLFKRLIGPPAHLSPFEHCAQNMTEEQYENIGHQEIVYLKNYNPNSSGKYTDVNFEEGWCKNFRGYIQLRDFVEKGIFNL